MSKGKGDLAEFIRVQIALETEPQGPLRTALKQREASLLNQYSRSWVVWGLTFATPFRFRRGFICLLLL